MARATSRRAPPAGDHADRIADLDRRVATVEAILEGIAAGVDEIRRRENQPTNWLAFLVAAGIIGSGGAVYINTRLAPTERSLAATNDLANRNGERQGEIRAIQDLLVQRRLADDETTAQLREKIAAATARQEILIELTSRLPYPPKGGK